MSYNLMAEGDLDLFELAQLSSQFRPLELFPIPAESTGPSATATETKLPRDALGIAVPRSSVGPEAFAALKQLVPLLWQRGAEVYDLLTGARLEKPADLDALVSYLSG